MKHGDEAWVVRGVSEDVYYSLDEDSSWQYVGGDLVREPTSYRHEDLFAFLLMLLRGYTTERGGGAVVLGSRYPMRLDEKWSPEPDVMVVLDAKRHLLGPQRLEGPADLVVEIASGSKPLLDVRRKLPRYRQAQAPEIWLINPFTRTVRAEVLVEGRYRARSLSQGRLASSVLPGFWIEVTWLWQEPPPSSLSCLTQILAS